MTDEPEVLTDEYQAFHRTKANKLLDERLALERAVLAAEDTLLAAQQALADWVDQHDGR